MMLSVVIILTGVITQSDALFHQKSMKIFKGPSSLHEGSLFGYSISYESNSQSLIVSAPKANNIGQIFTININSTAVTDARIDLHRFTPQLIKHDFWLGATVKATADYYVTCSPRYSEMKTDVAASKKKRPATAGVCYKISENNKIARLNAMSTSDRFINSENQFKKLMDSFGWSIDVTSQNDLLMGGPAMNKGRVLIYKNTLKYPKLIHKISYLNPVLYNFGYSIASGKFFSKKISYAVSTTYGNLGYGKVYFFNSKLENIGAINDISLGTMFGAALCTAHLGVDALLVGAPAFADSGYAYDVGAVYIYMALSGSSSNDMTLKRKLVGKSNGGYFGHAIVSVGDMDGDSKDEIAIAAPYDDDGKGAVYIYTGKGILEGMHWQKIQASDLSNLGVSLAVVNDIDENGCNELAISSPKTSSIVLLKSVAFITVSLRVEFPDLKNHQNKTHFEFLSCVDVSYPKKPKDIKAGLIVTIVTTDRNSKLIEATKNKTLTYEVTLNEKNSTYCRKIAVQSNLILEKEYNQVIAYTISATLKDDPLERDFDISRVILSEHSKLKLIGVEWISDCDGQACVPDLKHSINSSLTKPYFLGSSDLEKFTLSVKNVGQTAYGACAIVTVLEARVLRPPPGCTLLKDTQFLCKPYQPLRNGEIWNIHPIEVETTLLTSENDKLTIQSNLYNNCNNKTDENIFKDRFNLTCDIDNISLTGQTNPDRDVNMTRSDVYDLGKSMEHVYTISNNGKTNWIGVKSQIILDNVPYVDYSGTPITISKDKSSGIECSTTDSMKTESQIIVYCDIGDLKRSQKVNVIIAIVIPRNTLEFNEGSNVTITTKFNLLLNNDTISLSLDTMLRFITVPVALWISILSSLIGLTLLAIIILALYKGGYLQRKNKDKLKVLKREVYRQSMRRSMMRESMRAVASRRSTEDNQLLQPNQQTDEMDIDQKLIDELKTKIL